MEIILQLVEKGLELFISIASLDLVDIVKIKYWFVIFFILFYFCGGDSIVSPADNSTF